MEILAYPGVVFFRLSREDPISYRGPLTGHGTLATYRKRQVGPLMVGGEQLAGLARQCYSIGLFTLTFACALAGLTLSIIASGTSLNVLITTAMSACYPIRLFSMNTSRHQHT
jgi:hypothetical protein